MGNAGFSKVKKVWYFAFKKRPKWRTKQQDLHRTLV